jgi:hypothetical protein
MTRYILYLLLTAFCIVSCERHSNDETTSTLPSIYRASAMAARSEGSASYFIQTDGDPASVSVGIYGDGSHEIIGSNGNGEFTMHDYERGEDWVLQIGNSKQIVVNSDRTTEDVGEYAKVIESGIVFSETDNNILKLVASTFNRRHN